MGDCNLFQLTAPPVCSQTVGQNYRYPRSIDPLEGASTAILLNGGFWSSLWSILIVQRQHHSLISLQRWTQKNLFRTFSTIFVTTRYLVVVPSCSCVSISDLLLAEYNNHFLYIGPSSFFSTRFTTTTSMVMKSFCAQ